MPTIELLIKGKVQGVFFRASAQQRALALGLNGWVMNQPDGSVLLRATGNPEGLAQLEAWCKQGPSGAKVGSLEKRDLPEEEFERFQVIR